MDTYITQEIDVESMPKSYAILEEMYSRNNCTSSIKLERLSDFRDYIGSSFAIPIDGVNEYAISNNGVIMNTKREIAYIPRIIFNEHGIGERAEYDLRILKRKYDIAELVVMSRFNINPDNVRIDYTICTDGTYVFISSLKITFKEPDFFYIPFEYDMLAAKFFDQYLICRSLDRRWFVSKNGMVYDVHLNRFSQIYYKAFFPSHRDNARIMRPIVYIAGGETLLVKEILESWSGLSVPDGYTVMNTSGTAGLVSLENCSLTDLRTSRLHAGNIHKANVKLIKRRDEKLDRLRERIKKGIQKTEKILDKYYGMHLKGKVITI